jgi:hypothetical protein
MERTQVVPGWYWAVAIAALLWEGLGCFAYLTQVSMGAADYARLPADQAEMWRAMPVWAWSAYATAVWLGLAGAFLLLLRLRWARIAFAVSLVGIVVQFAWALLYPHRVQLSGGAALPAIIVVVGVLLLWFTGRAAARGWLR